MTATKNQGFLSIIVLSLFLLLLLPLTTQAAAGDAYGWFAPRVEYIGDGPGCEDLQILTIYLVNYNSTSTYTGTVGTWSVSVKNAAGLNISTDSYNGQLVSNPICYDAFSNSVQVSFKETNDTYELNTPVTISELGPAGPFAMIASLPPSGTSHHFAGYVHLRSKGGAGLAPNISSIFPNGEALQTTPDFFVKTNAMPLVYGPSTLKSIKVYTYNLQTGTYKSVTSAASGGIGTRQVSGMPTLTPDGSYLWFYHQNFTGTNYTHDLMYANSWTFISLPTTGVTSPLSFIIDSTKPEVNTITDIKTISATGTNQIQTKIDIAAQDLTSGLSLSSLIISDGSGLLISQIDVTLAGQRDQLNLSHDVVLDENTQYTLTHELTDKAGNKSTYTTTYTTPTVTSLSAPVLSGQTVTDIGSDYADIRSKIDSNGGSLIVERGTCWALSVSDFTSASGLTTCLSDGPSNAGFSTGVFSQMHLGLPASTTIYYQGYARNGSATGHSPILTFVTKPYGDVILPVPTLPVIGLTDSASTTADSSVIRLRIDDTGGAPLNERIICWSLPTLITPIPPPPPDIASGHCFVDNTPLIGSYVLPLWITTTFNGLPANSLINIISYVSNVVGTSTMLHTFRTAAKVLDIMESDFDVTQTYSSSTNKYNLDFAITAVDLSNFNVTTASGFRTVPYSVKLLDENGALVTSQTGTYVAKKPTSIPTPTPISITDINPGIYVLKVEANDPESTYLERAASSTAGENNLRVKILDLTDDVEEVPIGPKPKPPFDPAFRLYFGKDLTRSKTQTLLYWDTLLPYDMDCKIYGGSEFGPSSFYNFNPSIDGKTGSIQLNNLSNAQTYELTCFEPVLGTFFGTSTKISVTGSYTQI